MRYKVLVEFECADSATEGEIISFIEEELSAGGGNRHPADPLFNSLQNVQITLYKMDKTSVKGNTENV